MSTQNVPQDAPTPKASIEDLLRTAITTPPPPDTLAGSLLDPTQGLHGLGAVEAALPVALRRLGVLLGALEDPEGSHPCITDDSVRETVRDELSEIEAILEIIQREAEAAAEASRPATATS